MNYLIIGGEFNNKGAEAMTLIAIDNIVRNDPDSTIYLWDKKTKVPYQLTNNVHLLHCPDKLLKVLAGDKLAVKDRIKEVVKFFIPNRESIFKYKKKVKSVLETIDVTMDISGYALSSKWSDYFNIRYCNWIDVMAGYGSKVYLMPQSFGPFDYKSDSMKELISNSLSKCSKIFARETKGYNELTGLGLTNVEHCYDSVLIDNVYDPARVIKDYDKRFEDISVPQDKSIAIIPNYRLIDHGGYDYNELIDFYCKIINEKSDYCFYLVAHAGEDMKICKAVKERFTDNDKVVLIDHVPYSFNYENFVRKVSFIIASRYHSLIHAYKECTPAAILGWADKYEDVAGVFDQSKYVIDIKDFDAAMSVISDLCINCDTERQRIHQSLIEVQKYNCYSFLAPHGKEQ